MYKDPALSDLFPVNNSDLDILMCCSMLDMILTIFLQCANLVISWVGLVRRDLAILAWVDSGAAGLGLSGASRASRGGTLGPPSEGEPLKLPSRAGSGGG
jgi:hypothetical protein